LSPNRYEVDLLNEVQNIDFSQEAAKLFEVKVGGRKKYRPLSLVQTDAPGFGGVSRYFFPSPTLTSNNLAAP